MRFTSGSASTRERSWSVPSAVISTWTTPWEPPDGAAGPSRPSRHSSSAKAGCSRWSGLRGPPLDRRRDPGHPRQPACGAYPSARELSPRVPACLGQPRLLPDRSPRPRDRRRVAPRPARGRPVPQRAQAAPPRATPVTRASALAPARHAAHAATRIVPACLRTARARGPRAGAGGRAAAGDSLHRARAVRVPDRDAPGARRGLSADLDGRGHGHAREETHRPAARGRDQRPSRAEPSPHVELIMPWREDKHTRLTVPCNRTG
jgi:hypothetical protein